MKDFYPWCRWLACVLILMPLAGCGATARSTSIANSRPATAQTTTAQAAGQPAASAIVERIARATVLTIRDDWNGLSPVAPIEAHYTLQRQGDRFTGTARFGAGGYGPSIRVAETPITIPPEAFMAYLHLLEQAPVTTGSYSPRITHTDDYPHIALSFEGPDGPTTLLTESNTKDRAPWSIWTPEKVYVINDAQPTTAFEVLRRHLRPDIRDDLVQQAMRATRATPQAGTASQPLACRSGNPPSTPTREHDPDRVDTGQQANPATRLPLNIVQSDQLRTATMVQWSSPTGYFAPLTGTPDLTTLLDILDQPLLPAPIRGQHERSHYARFNLTFRVGAKNVVVEYDAEHDELSRDRGDSWRAPAGLGDVILGALCGKP